MKLIKLTNSENENTIYINEKHLIAFWEEDGDTVIITSNDDAIGYAKETPLEILDMMIDNESSSVNTLAVMLEQERVKESGQLWV